MTVGLARDAGQFRPRRNWRAAAALAAAVTGWVLPQQAHAADTTTTTSTSTVTTTLNNLTATPKVRIIEWDLPSNADMSPGAMVVDTLGHDKASNRLWFVTRQGVSGPASVYQMSFPRSLMRGPAQWTAYKLSDLAIITGGLRKVKASWDRRFIFVRTIASLERIDTRNCYGTPQTCQRTLWLDEPSDVLTVSDLSVDDRNNVFTTHAVNPGDSSADLSYVQKLTPASTLTGAATVTRWHVGGGAGFCLGATSSAPCVSGIAVHPTNRNLVYYSEPEGNNVAELNTTTNTVRRWSLALLPPVPPAKHRCASRGNFISIVGAKSGWSPGAATS